MKSIHAQRFNRTVIPSQLVDFKSEECEVKIAKTKPRKTSDGSQQTSDISEALRQYIIAVFDAVVTV